MSGIIVLHQSIVNLSSNNIGSRNICPEDAETSFDPCCAVIWLNPSFSVTWLMHRTVQCDLWVFNVLMCKTRSSCQDTNKNMANIEKYKIIHWNQHEATDFITNIIITRKNEVTFQIMASTWQASMSIKCITYCNSSWNNQLLYRGYMYLKNRWLHSVIYASKYCLVLCNSLRIRDPNILSLYQSQLRGHAAVARSSPSHKLDSICTSQHLPPLDPREQGGAGWFEFSCWRFAYCGFRRGVKINVAVRT